MILSTRAQKISNTEELRRCALDPKYFMMKYILSEVSSVQEKFIDGILEFKQLIVKHPRQGGFTTASMAYLLWEMMFMPNRTSVVVLSTVQIATNLTAIVRVMQQKLPSWLRSEILYEGRDLLKFENESKLSFVACSERSMHGVMFDTLYIGDMAYADEAHLQGFWKNVASRIDSHTRVLIHSTPKPDENLFKTLFQKAAKERSMLQTMSFEYCEMPYASLQHESQTISYIGFSAFRIEFMALFENEEPTA